MASESLRHDHAVVELVPALARAGLLHGEPVLANLVQIFPEPPRHRRRWKRGEESTPAHRGGHDEPPRPPKPVRHPAVHARDHDVTLARFQPRRIDEAAALASVRRHYLAHESAAKLLQLFVAADSHDPNPAGTGCRPMV